MAAAVRYLRRRQVMGTGSRKLLAGLVLRDPDAAPFEL
jgi:hypothetical protein